MSKKWFCIFLFLSVASALHAGDLRRIQKKYENQDWEKTEELIRKSIGKEPVNPGAKFYYSRLFLESSFSRPNLDSARIFIFKALSDLEKASEEVLEELTNEGITARDLVQLHDSISKLCFARAEKRSTIGEWNAFLTQFPSFSNRQAAIDQRDKLLYDQLLKSLSISSARDFLEMYSASIFTERAKNKLDSMLVRKHQTSQSQEDLVQFISENPASDYMLEALEHLLPLMTLSGSKPEFLNFIRKYPKTKTAISALAVLFHLDAEDNFSMKNSYLDYHPKSDSLRSEIRNKDSFFFPVFEKTFQLVSTTGRSVETGLTDLDQDLICDGINSDILSGLSGENPKIVNLHGKTLFNGRLVKELSHGFLLIENGNQKSLVHKSGLRILEMIEDVEVLKGGFLKVKKEKWGLYTLLGLKIAEHRFDDIFIKGNF